MSRVFVATETALGRKVVVKVLPPEMGAGVNADRFRREIQLAASLQHPHIVPLLHAGRQAELLYYTMPLVEGESLRAKLAREGELPIGEAVRILRDVVDALAYAHAHGVVHRDIKPDNVLITGHHAVVTDFGVAKALSEATGEHSLTSIGVALGTPAYMSPEQAAGEQVDHRADIYSLGVLAYEVFAGRLPFVGANAHQILAAHVTQAPDPLTKHRTSVPPALAAVVMRCLEKKPADRWQHAAELHAQLENMATPSGGTAPTTAVPAARPRRSQLRLGLAAGAGVVLAGVIAFALRGNGGAGVDDNMVAVLPFRVAGADPSLHYLREGMIDLLAAKLTGEGGPRAADPRTVTSAFRRAAGSEHEDLSQADAVDVAREIGAGQALLGGIVGSPAHVTLSATVVAVPGGAQRAQASVAGPADSLPALVDRLTSQLLIRGAALGSGEASLTTRSLPALQAFLAGQRAYRRGEYDSAAARFSRAVALDSSFTLADMGLLLASGWGVLVRNIGRVRELAWEGRDRLSQRDRTLLEAYLGPRFPEPPLQADLLAARERAVSLNSDVADAWYLLADKYFHEGQYLGRTDWMERAAAGFERAVALDSSFAGPLSHLVNLAALRGDSAAARRWDRLYAQHSARSGRFDHIVRWDLARVTGDHDLMRDFWTNYDTAANRPEYLAGYIIEMGGPVVAADSVIAILARRTASDAARLNYHGVRFLVDLNTGQPSAARAQLDSAARLEPGDMGWASLRVLAALYGDGDSTDAAAAIQTLARGATVLPDSGPERWGRLESDCVVELWRLATNQTAGVTRTVARLRAARPPRDPLHRVRDFELCASLLEATAATLARRPEALRLVQRADSLMLLGPGLSSPPYQNLAIGRLYAALGEPARARATLIRAGPNSQRLFAANYEREIGRVAALAGDRDAAIAAYNRYLELRANAEPALKPRVEEVRAELARLVGEIRRAVFASTHVRLRLMTCEKSYSLH